MIESLFDYFFIPNWRIIYTIPKLILVFALIRLLKKYLYSTNGKDKKSVVKVQGLDNAYNFNNQWYFFCGR